MKGVVRDRIDPKTAAVFSDIHGGSAHHHPPSDPFSHHFLPLEVSPSSKEDDFSPAAATTTRPSPSPTPPPHDPLKPPESADGPSIEISRRPRGRPPGSKNRPKPAVIVERVPDRPVMSPYILEIPAGADIVESISGFCRRKGMGLCILTGSGHVANCTLRQPSVGNVHPGATVTFHGRFEILSVSATFLEQTVAIPIPNGFSISLAGPQGQIVGGFVVGPLVASGTVFVVAAAFNNPSYHRLMQEEEEEDDDVEIEKSRRKSTPPPPPTSGGMGMSTMYSTPMASNVMWATPQAKQHHQHQY